MWNRSYRWQREARVAAGAALLVVLLAALVVLGGTAPARRARVGARDLVSELRSPAEQMIEVAVPADLHARPGTLVYLERQDGVAQIAGRVENVHAVDRNQAHVTIRLMAHVAGAQAAGGILKGAPASLDLRDAVRLLISPNTPNEEMLRARDVIWPSVQTNVLPAMIDGLIRETSQKLVSLDEQDQALLVTTVERLREELRPLEEQLIDRLARRAWEVVGVKGLATGIWRTTTGSVQNKTVIGADVWRQIIGDQIGASTVNRPFLPEETSHALQAALEEETLEFWQENRATILEAVVRVASEQRGEFEEAFRERWAGALYEQAVVPAWLAGQDKVLEAVQKYANDFAARRLLTKQGGPRLLFAYALRSSLDISDAPLLVFAPAAAGRSDRVVYEPFLR